MCSSDRGNNTDRSLSMQTSSYYDFYEKTNVNGLQIVFFRTKIKESKFSYFDLIHDHNY